jgi:hypothetical protein
MDLFPAVPVDPAAIFVGIAGISSRLLDSG